MNTYKVHSAIYSWDTPGSAISPAYDVTHVVQNILNDKNNKGIIPVNNGTFQDPAPGKTKSFAIVVSIVSPDREIITRFCTCPEGPPIDVNNSGVICDF
jgi:hypothetical protein